MRNKIFLLAACICCVAGCAVSEIVVHPVPRGIYYARHNDDFTVKVRHAGGQWVDLYEYKVKVDMDKPQEASMVYFDFSGSVEVLVQKNNGDIRSACIRPTSKGIDYTLLEDGILFTLNRPENISVEFNGDRSHNLHLFSNPLETEVPDSTDVNVMYFAPGIHEPADTATRSFVVPSHTTVYLAGGAILKGRLLCDSVEDVRIMGRGFLLEPQQGITVDYARNVLIQDIMVVNPRYNSITVGQSREVSIRNVRSFSHQGWGDGIDFFCSENIKVDGVFLRNSDDCIAVYNHRWNYFGDTRNVVVENATLWADVAHPINIGTHGNTEGCDEVMENMVFRNIDILEHDEDDRDYQGCMAVNVGDHNLARNILFDDIRVERIQEGQLFHLRVVYNEKYNTGAGRGIEHVAFRNISCKGRFINPSVIAGYDSGRMVRGITFENIYLNGEKVRRLDDLNVEIKDFVEKIKVK